MTRTEPWRTALLAMACVVACTWSAHAAGATDASQDDVDRLRRQVYSSDPDDRLYAAATLLERGHREAFKILEDVLRGPNNQGARLSVLDAIDRRRDPRFIVILLDILGDADEKVRRRVAEVVGAFSNHGVVERLGALARDPQGGEAAQLGAIEALVITRQRPAVGVLIDLLKSRHKAVRTAALEVLRAITLADHGENVRAWEDWWDLNRDKAPIQWIQELIPKAEFQRARRMAIDMALELERRITDPKERAEFLKKHFKRPYSELRIRAAQELPKIAEAEGVLEVLVSALGDRDVQVVAAVAAGLGVLGDVKAVPAVQRLLSREEPEVRAAAAGALGRLRATDAVADLVKLLADAEPIVRVAATEALGAMQPREAFDALVERLFDENAQVRQAAVPAVARFKDPKAVPSLVKVLLEDRDARARWFAARDLAEFPGREVDDALVRGLADTDSGVRGAAAASLGKRDDPALVDPLIARSQSDEAAAVRKEAWTSALALLERAGSLAQVDRVSQRLMDDKADTQAADVLEKVEGLAAKATPEEKALVATLRRRRAEALFRAGNWAQAASAYRVLYVAGDKTVETRLADSLARAGDVRAAAQVYLSALPAEAEARAARLATVIGLAEGATAADRPREAILILRSLRQAHKPALNGNLEGRLKRAAASAGIRLAALAQAATGRVEELLGRAAANGSADAKAAAADLVRLGWVGVPGLLNGLGDAEINVRAAAAAALRTIAGTSKDFKADGTNAERQAAVERWRTWFTGRQTVPEPPTD